MYKEYSITVTDILKVETIFKNQKKNFAGRYRTLVKNKIAKKLFYSIIDDGDSYRI